jgi:hypothetical protein
MCMPMRTKVCIHILKYARIQHNECACMCISVCIHTTYVTSCTHKYTQAHHTQAPSCIHIPNSMNTTLDQAEKRSTAKTMASKNPEDTQAASLEGLAQRVSLMLGSSLHADRDEAERLRQQVAVLTEETKDLRAKLERSRKQSVLNKVCVRLCVSVCCLCSAQWKG